MKQRILLIVAMLLIATPAFAAVQVISVDKGGGVVEVNYICTEGTQIRAFALDVSVDVGMFITDVCEFVRGESNAATPGYGIFPARFRDTMTNPSDPNWVNPSYIPVAPANDIGAYGMDVPSVVLEMGALYPASAPEANKPGSSGKLCRLVVDQNGTRPDCNLTVGANSIRGGVVDTAGNTVTASFLGSPKVTFLVPPCTISGRVFGKDAPRNTGLGGVTISGLTGNPVTAADGTYTATVASGFSGTATPTDANGQWDFSTPGPGSRQYTNVTSNQTAQDYNGTALECVNARDAGTGAGYTYWVTLGKRDCWCKKKQCNGDTDGKATAGKNVVAADLTTFTKGYNKTVATLVTLMPTEPNDICADFDHKATASKPVVAADLTIFTTWYNKTGVPDCTGTYINAWK